MTGFFTLPEVFKVHPYFSMYHQYFISFYNWIILHCMNRPLLIHLLISWAFGFFPPFDYYEWGCCEDCIHMFVWRYVFISLHIYLGVELVDHMANLCLTFWGTINLFSKVAVSLYISTSNEWGFPFLHILVSMCSYLYCYFGYPDGCEVVPHCFDLYFPDG